jgi:hypothetical protein
MPGCEPVKKQGGIGLFGYEYNIRPGKKQDERQRDFRHV